MTDLGQSPLVLQGSLAADGLVDFLNQGEALGMYVTVLITAGVEETRLVLASGRIVLENADDLRQRRIAQQRTVDIIRKHRDVPGTFRSTPVFGIREIDSLPSVAVSDVLRVVTSLPISSQSTPPLRAASKRPVAAPPTSTPVPQDPEPQVPTVHVKTHPQRVAAVRPAESPTSAPRPDRPRPSPVSQGAAIGPERAERIRQLLNASRAEASGASAPAGADSDTPDDEIVSAVVASQASGDGEGGRSDALMGLIRRLTS